MINENDKGMWWGLSKLEILEPFSNVAYIYSNGRNRVSVTVKVIPINKDHNVIGKDELSDEDIKRYITLIDAVDESPLPFNDLLNGSTFYDRWSYTDNVDLYDPSNKFVKSPLVPSTQPANKKLAPSLMEEEARLIKFNIYCKARVGGSLKRIAIKVSPPGGQAITSLKGPAAGAAFITMSTLTPLNYTKSDIVLNYSPYTKAENSCGDDGSVFRVIELQLNSKDFKLVASEISGNVKSPDEIQALRVKYFDNENEFPWIHRAAMLSTGAYSYYCWGFDHIPKETNADHNSIENPYALGRGHSYCYVKINEIYTKNQEAFFILIIRQKNRGSIDELIILDKIIKVKLYDQFGNLGAFTIQMGERLFGQAVDTPDIDLDNNVTK